MDGVIFCCNWVCVIVLVFSTVENACSFQWCARDRGQFIQLVVLKCKSLVWGEML
jgi:hypothetical protein